MYSLMLAEDVIRAVDAPFYGTTRYPYPFIDVDQIGGWVALVVPVMAAAFYALGRLYVFLDKKLALRVPPLTVRHIYLRNGGGQ